MCGLFEIKNEKCDKKSNKLVFNASVIEGETMKITISPGEGKKMNVKKITADNAQSSYIVKDGYLIVSLLNESANADTKVTVEF